MEYNVTHNEQKNCFETECDGFRAVLQYRPFEGGVVFTHTYVPKPIEGRGVAASLVKNALAYCRENNLKVKAGCSYVASYIKRHPQEVE